MIGIADVHYTDRSARAALIVAETWTSPAAIEKSVSELTDVAEYEPGAFYERELPCLTKVLEQCRIPLQAIVVDGYVWLDGDGRKGLGARLFDVLEGRCPVIGVAKTRFQGAPAIEVRRGTSQQPLFVTAIGTNPDEAAVQIQRMHGEFRIPTLLKLCDQLARGIVGQAPA